MKRWVHVTLTQCYAANRSWFNVHSFREVLSFKQRQGVVFAMLSACLLLWLAPGAFFTGCTFVIYTLYLIALLFKMKLLLLGREIYKEVHNKKCQQLLMDEQLPLYTIIIPLFKEAAVVPQLIKALSELDYPKEKLEILLLTEEQDIQTMAALHANELPTPLTKIVVLPHMAPQTKPKACNVGLALARGELLALFDAEDVPHPQQLRLAATEFARLPSEVACLQASLHIQPRLDSLLSQWFAVEFRQWFDFMLPALERLGGPIPLGGTSNHFRVNILRMQQGWDPYNVTEDAELGLRLAKHGYQTCMLGSYTLEEAPSTLLCWFNQRSRWIKGYMQTYCRHASRQGYGLKGWILIQFFLGVQTLQHFLSPVCLVVAIGWKIKMAGNVAALPGIIMPATLVFALLLHSLSLLFIFQVRPLRPISKLLLLFYPFYFYLHSLAAWKALYQLFICPHYWEKTPHLGLRCESDK